jgi:hypothetical protein
MTARVGDVNSKGWLVKVERKYETFRSGEDTWLPSYGSNPAVRRLTFTEDFIDHV